MKVLVAGDFVPQARVKTQIEIGDYSCLEEVKPIIQSVDYSIVNFESPVVLRKASSIIKSGPALNCTQKAMACIAQAGFNCVTLANNHFRDYGQVGVDDTIQACREYNIDYVGGGINLFEAEKILYKEINGKILSVINICENEWSVANDELGGSAPLDPIKNYYTIKEARCNSDYVLVIVHGGIERYQYPTQRMVDTYHFFIDAGADAVVNHHQHCFSGFETYNNCPIFYGLGNFCFDKNNPNDTQWSRGYFVIIDFMEAKTTYEIVPYTQCLDTPSIVLHNESMKSQFTSEILYINRVISNKTDLHVMFESFLDQIGERRILSLEPFKNKYIKAMQARGCFPRFIKGKMLLNLCNSIRCESHKEVIQQLLQREIDKGI